MIYSNVILLPTKRVIKYRDSCTSLLPFPFTLVWYRLPVRSLADVIVLVSGSRPLQIEASLGLVFNGGFPYLEKEKYLSLINGLGSPLFVWHILSIIVFSCFLYPPCTDVIFASKIKQFQLRRAS